MPLPPQITKHEFTQFQQFIFELAGITLPDSKQALVSGRLAKRLNFYGLNSYGDYFKLLNNPSISGEVQIAVDLLTTNETYFFREQKHFDFLRQKAIEARGQRHTKTFRVWSAASSSGEESYSIAMVLADCLEAHGAWEVIGSDISSRVLQGAKRAHYSIERTRNIPSTYLQRFCLRGIDEYKNTILVDRAIRNKVHFRQINLNTALPELGFFDVVFLRNVMIYFNDDTKRGVLSRVISTIHPGGHFIVGHSESLKDLTIAVKPLAPSIYRKPL